MIKSGAINKSQYPFTPRAIEIDYVSPPKQRVTFLEVSASVCNPCGSLYPFDLSNLSINDFLSQYIVTFENEIMESFSGEFILSF